MTFGEIVVVLVLIAISGLAVRSMWRSHKTGGHCNGDCGHCGGCHK
ncbi:FeoB-associated Cys-rich membrane protein [Colidextribacter sp. OB.20]|nr:FeoB-associated Cys-rich membrane protein [Colidextribacter sp. OB.20]NBI09302.1 FeoB-associated Cys-rich membrane protein [Colidextribacter sp. OB.20]